MFDRILVPLDGSAAAETAVSYAELIPSRRVDLLRVEEDGPEVWHEIAPSGDEIRSWLLVDDSETQLDRVAQVLRRPGRRVEIVRLAGDPAERIIEVASAVDLVVMATRGLGGARRAFLGSVADRVAREAPAPTLLVREDRRPAGPPVSGIVVPLDGSGLAEEALPLAARLAGLLGLPMRVIRVVAPSARAEARDYLEAVAGRLREQGVAISAEVRAGAAVAALLAAIAASDLVVMTTHGRGGLRRLILGSVADRLVREAPSPVLLQRAGALREAGGAHGRPARG